MSIFESKLQEWPKWRKNSALFLKSCINDTYGGHNYWILGRWSIGCQFISALCCHKNSPKAWKIAPIGQNGLIRSPCFGLYVLSYELIERFSQWCSVKRYGKPEFWGFFLSPSWAKNFSMKTRKYMSLSISELIVLSRSNLNVAFWRSSRNNGSSFRARAQGSFHP